MNNMQKKQGRVNLKEPALAFFAQAALEPSLFGLEENGWS
jgi:hypothetical protein